MFFDELTRIQLYPDRMMLGVISVSDLEYKFGGREHALEHKSNMPKDVLSLLQVPAKYPIAFSLPANAP